MTTRVSLLQEAFGQQSEDGKNSFARFVLIVQYVVYSFPAFTHARRKMDSGLSLVTAITFQSQLLKPGLMGGAEWPQTGQEQNGSTAKSKFE